MQQARSGGRRTDTDGQGQKRQQEGKQSSTTLTDVKQSLQLGLGAHGKVKLWAAVLWGVNRLSNTNQVRDGFGK